VVSRTIFLKTNNFRRIRRALLAYVQCGGLALKGLNYKDVTIGIQCMWKVETTVIPVITGVTKTISKSFTKYLSNITGKQDIKELQKTAKFDTVQILWKILM